MGDGKQNYQGGERKKNHGRVVMLIKWWERNWKGELLPNPWGRDESSASKRLEDVQLAKQVNAKVTTNLRIPHTYKIFRPV